MNVETKWWEEFFTGLLLDYQRQTKTEEHTLAEADFIQKILKLAPGTKVLDVPCGEGRLSIELASRGYQVVGVDITLPFLDDARRKAKERQLDIVLEHRDMRDLIWEEEFDGAFCFWGSFGYFDDKGNVDFLKAVHRSLKSGSKFLVDTHVTETILPKLLQERAWSRKGDIIVLEERRYDYRYGRTETEFILMREGKTFKKSTVIRLYTYRELSQLLESVGFAQCQEYSSLSGERFQLGSPRLYLVATKM